MEKISLDKVEFEKRLQDAYLLGMKNIAKTSKELYLAEIDKMESSATMGVYPKEIINDIVNEIMTAKEPFVEGEMIDKDLVIAIIGENVNKYDGRL